MASTLSPASAELLEQRVLVGLLALDHEQPAVAIKAKEQMIAWHDVANRLFDGRDGAGVGRRVQIDRQQAHPARRHDFTSAGLNVSRDHHLGIGKRQREFETGLRGRPRPQDAQIPLRQFVRHAQPQRIAGEPGGKRLALGRRAGPRRVLRILGQLNPHDDLRAGGVGLSLDQEHAARGRRLHDFAHQHGHQAVEQFEVVVDLRQVVRHGGSERDPSQGCFVQSPARVWRRPRGTYGAVRTARTAPRSRSPSRQMPWIVAVRSATWSDARAR